MPHLPVTRPLLELHTKLIKALTSLLDIVNSEGDMPEPTARIGVPVCVSFEIGVALGPVVVRELKDAWISETTCYLRA